MTMNTLAMIYQVKTIWVSLREEEGEGGREGGGGGGKERETEREWNKWV